MKIRVIDRVLVGLAGLLLIAVFGAVIAQLYFGVDMIAIATRVLTAESLQWRILRLVIAALILLLGIYCVALLFRRRGRKGRFVTQMTDSGELSISLSALEDMVNKCLEPHTELDAQQVELENQKDGLVVRIRGIAAGGVSLPLTVEALQKQIRQYVTACSGVEVRNVRVEIDSSGPDAKDALFSIPAPMPQALLHEAESPVKPHEAEEKREEPATEGEGKSEEGGAKAPQPAPAPMPPIPEVEEDDDRPLHQRIFSNRPEPCIVPMPPEAEEEQASEESMSEEDSPDEVNEAEEASAPIETILEEEEDNADERI